jgi:hypothetical protein
MASPAGILGYLRRKIGGLTYLSRHVQEDTEALYGPNPNDITPEAKMGQMGPGGGGPPVQWWETARSTERERERS